MTTPRPYSFANPMPGHIPVQGRTQTGGRAPKGRTYGTTLRCSCGWVPSSQTTTGLKDGIPSRRVTRDAKVSNEAPTKGGSTAARLAYLRHIAQVQERTEAGWKALTPPELEMGMLVTRYFHHEPQRVVLVQKEHAATTWGAGSYTVTLSSAEGTLENHPSQHAADACWWLAPEPEGALTSEPSGTEDRCPYTERSAGRCTLTEGHTDAPHLPEGSVRLREALGHTTPSPISVGTRVLVNVGLWPGTSVETDPFEATVMGYAPGASDLVLLDSQPEPPEGVAMSFHHSVSHRWHLSRLNPVVHALKSGDDDAHKAVWCGHVVGLTDDNTTSLLETVTCPSCQRALEPIFDSDDDLPPTIVVPSSWNYVVSDADAGTIKLHKLLQAAIEGTPVRVSSGAFSGEFEGKLVSVGPQMIEVADAWGRQGLFDPSLVEVIR